MNQCLLAASERPGRCKSKCQRTRYAGPNAGREACLSCDRDGYSNSNGRHAHSATKCEGYQVWDLRRGRKKRRLR